MKYKIILLALITLAAILRLYKLGTIPQGLYLDEPSLGYNAWSILTTGHDEHNQLLPLSFQAFGEYKLPGYIYGSVPLIALFGLNAFSIRLLSALAGITGVWGIYLLTKQLLSKDTEEETPAEKTALIAALLFAITPWSIQLSRAAFETNTALTLLIFGSYFLLKWIRTPTLPKALPPLLLLAATFYTYNAARIVVPLLLITTLAIYGKNLSKKTLSIFCLIAVLILLPGSYGSLLGNESSRVQAVFELENKQYMLGAALGTLEKYLTNFSPEFLFFFGDAFARHSVHEMGMLLLPLLFLIPLGIYKTIRTAPKAALLLGMWLLISPLPASIATPVPHALRALTMLPPLIVFAAMGVRGIRELRIPKGYRLSFSVLLILTTLYAVASHLHIYYNHYAYKTSWDWNENDTLLAQYLAKKYPNPQLPIVIEGDTNRIIYIRFFNAELGRQTDPSKYYYVQSMPTEELQDGQVIAITGWKGTPDNLHEVKELKMVNNSIGYKVGVWKKK